MIVTLDGRRLRGSFPTHTLQALIDQVRQTHLAGRLIVAVTLDGQQLLDQELSQQLSGSVDGIKHVELISADPRGLVSDALREVAGQLASAADNQAAVADQLQSGEMSEATAAFGEFLQVWQTCQRTIVDCSGLLDEDLTATQSGGQPIRAHLDGLADKLRELRDAFEARDTVLLSDLFQYEMPQTCKTWQGILNDLAGTVAGQVGAATS
jgi:hypothetical protein